MSVRSPAPASQRDMSWTTVAAIGVMLLCWILGNPRSSGPDEPSHMVASAGFVRGQGTGDVSATDPAIHVMQVPAMVGEPNPACWALKPETPVTCVSLPPGTELVDRPTTSFNYPVWGLLLPGITSFVPWASGYAYLARLAQALVVLVLLAWTLRRLRAERPILAGAALLGVTPIAWFTFGTVNPSAIAIVGGLALAAGLLTGRRDANGLAVAGWLAVVLVRRDGPLWATVIVVLACVVLPSTPSALWARFSRTERSAVVLASTVMFATAAWKRNSLFEVALAAAPLALIPLDVGIRYWPRWFRTRGQQVAAAVAVSLAVVGLVLGAAMIRPGGFDSKLLQLVVGHSTDHLYQLVGLLGWLDTPVPPGAVLLYWAMFGGIVTVAVIDRPRSAVAALGGLAAVVVLAWILELGQGSSYGEYWQGRYSMPVAIGLPLLAVWRSTSPLSPASVDRLRRVLVVVFFIIANAGFIAAQHRWAVGTYGSWLPWRWDTWGGPFSPTLLVLANLAASASLAYHVGFTEGLSARQQADDVTTPAIKAGDDS